MKPKPNTETSPAEPTLQPKQAAKIAHWPLSRLKPYARNARTHSEAQVAKIAASIAEFGFTNPILSSADGEIIAGHGRLAAAQKLGMDVVPVVVLDHLSATQRRALVLADNRLALDAGWDDGVLALELRDLQVADFDLSLTGFGDDEIAALLAGLDATPDGDTDADSVPMVQAEAVTKLGDVWVLGNHRIMCGNATIATDVATLLGTCVPHLMVTDPPYGVGYDADWRNDALRSDGTPTDGRAIGKVENDDRSDWREAWALFPGEVAYVWHGASRSNEVADSLIACGFSIYSQIIWAKNQLVIGRGHYHQKHEPCFYAVRNGGIGHWQGDRTQTTVWDINKPQKSETGHSTQKPIECMRKPIENNSRAGDSIYDPFVGSGTTIIAAEQTGRRCYAMELSPLYVDVAVRRWQLYANKRAILESSGAPFPEDA